MAKTVLLAAAIGFVVGAMISALIFGDDGAGVEARHLAVAVPAGVIGGVVGHVMQTRGTSSSEHR